MDPRRGRVVVVVRGVDPAAAAAPLFFLERRRVARFPGAECRPAVQYYRVEAVGAEVTGEGGGLVAAIRNGLMAEN